MCDAYSTNENEMLARTRLLLTLPLLARGMSAQSARTCDAFEWHWLPSTTSTQDATKELLKARAQAIVSQKSQLMHGSHAPLPRISQKTMTLLSRREINVRDCVCFSS